MYRIKNALVVLCALSASVMNIFAQTETPPLPSAPKAATVPAVTEKKLPNGLTVAIVERKSAPLVSVRLMVNSGYTIDDINTAGLARMTTNLLTKGTLTRNATQIAEAIEFLGGDISTEIGPDNSGVSIDVTSDKVEQGMGILSDVALNPTFPETELQLAKSQALDELKYNLKQPGFLVSYVASVYSLYLTPSGGTPESLTSMKRQNIADFYKESYRPKEATLIFVGDITSEKAVELALQYFGKWKQPPPAKPETGMSITEDAGSITARIKTERQQPLLKRMLVIDLPQSGQAAVSFVKHLQFAGHVVWDDKKHRGVVSKNYFPGVVMNAVLGGGYSARLNEEIRIKRGLTYGASSTISWRAYDARFSTQTQTKNQSAAEVAELVVNEVRALQQSSIDHSELVPRSATLLGNYDRRLETNRGLLSLVADLYSNWLDSSELNNYLSYVEGVKADEIRDFAAQNLNGGDIIIAGDYSVFKDDLAKRFPNMTVDVIKAGDLDLSKDNLRK